MHVAQVNVARMVAPLDDPQLAGFALWWVDEGATPSIEEAKDRLERLRRHGPSAAAFTFRRIYEPA